MTEPFHGAKIAILDAGHVLTILRDDDPGIAWPGYWDLPGGAREGDETILACVRRETREELGLDIAPATIRQISLHRVRHGTVGFVVAEVPGLDLGRIRFGSEGQCWRRDPLDVFLGRRAIPGLQDRLARYLAGTSRSPHGRGAAATAREPISH